MVLLLYVDIGAVMHTLATLQPAWLGWAAVAIVLSTLLGACNAHLLVNRLGEVPWRLFLPVYWCAWALSLVVPGQIGDVAGISLMLRKYQLAWHVTLARSLLDKAISLLVMLLFAGSGLFLVGRQYMTVDMRSMTITGMVVLMGLLFIMLLRRRLGRLFDPGRTGLRGLLGRLFAEALATARQHPLRLGLNISLSILKIILIGLSYWLVFAALGQADIPVFSVIALAAASSIVAYVPVTFNGLGTVEATGILLFTQLGLGASSVLSAYLCLRLLVYLLAWLPAGIWLLRR
jgi:uncharacterized membrane protein YbhN (UPF0104 family)